MLVALEVLFSLRKKKVASKLLNIFKPLPQVLENVNVINKEKIIKSSNFKKAVSNATKLMGHKGRILVRKSGTEPKIRIMSESEDSRLNKLCVNIIKKSIQ